VVPGDMLHRHCLPIPPPPRNLSAARLGFTAGTFAPGGRHGCRRTGLRGLRL